MNKDYDFEDLSLYYNEITGEYELLFTSEHYFNKLIDRLVKEMDFDDVMYALSRIISSRNIDVLEEYKNDSGLDSIQISM